MSRASRPGYVVEHRGRRYGVLPRKLVLDGLSWTEALEQLRGNRPPWARDSRVLVVYARKVAPLRGMVVQGPQDVRQLLKAVR